MRILGLFPWASPTVVEIPWPLRPKRPDRPPRARQGPDIRRQLRRAIARVARVRADARALRYLDEMDLVVGVGPQDKPTLKRLLAASGSRESDA